MKDEKKESIKCPACGIENARNRLTCEVCHERLIPNPKKLTESSQAEKPDKKSRKKKEALSEEKANNIPTKVETPPDEVGQRSLLAQSEVEQKTDFLPIKQRKSRKKRVKIVKENEPVFFVLQGGKLQAVRITFGTLKPIKRKELSVTECNVLSVWNRTKDLINNN